MVLEIDDGIQSTCVSDRVQERHHRPVLHLDPQYLSGCFSLSAQLRATGAKHLSDSLSYCEFVYNVFSPFEMKHSKMRFLTFGRSALVLQTLGIRPEGRKRKISADSVVRPISHRFSFADG